ncbi:MAG TPA: HAMP domain-containing sensor histidine kinase [Chloroflexota bacterium]|nr:HAMP domain-containing sensor histidine kinase [Chloroflexota bacterium]
MSLRLRLTLLNGLVLLLAIGVFAALAYAIQARGLRNSLDTSLEEQARWFSDNASVWFDRPSRRLRGVVLPDPRTFTAPDVLIQIDSPNGEVEGRSRSLGDRSLPLEQEMVRRAFAGQAYYSDIDVDGQPVRLYVAPLRVGRPGEESPTIVAMIQVARPLSPLYESLHSLQTSFLLVGAAGVLVSLIAGWLLARAALRPIDRLAAAAHAVGTSRDFGRRVPEPVGASHDEVGRLAGEFNRMLGQLQAAYNQLEAALAAQRRFVADASHELRTPLAVLRGNLDLLGRQATVGASPTLVSDMLSETERMGRLVGDLLLLAQADAGQHLTLAPVAIVPVVQDAFRAARFIREDVELRLGDTPEEAWVEGDSDRLKQLLLILLDNALKYTPSGGRVTLAARAEGVSISLSVSDTGPGIQPEERARIFERFYRADLARGRGGAGLGLAIARWIVDEHHGSLEVESNPGRGSIFRVRLATIPVPAEARIHPDFSPEFRPAAAGAATV